MHLLSLTDGLDNAYKGRIHVDVGEDLGVRLRREGYARMARKKKPAIVDGFMTENVVLVLHRADALADKAVAAKVAELLNKHETLSVQWYDASGVTQTYNVLTLPEFAARTGL